MQHLRGPGDARKEIDATRLGRVPLLFAFKGSHNAGTSVSSNEGDMDSLQTSPDIDRAGQGSVRCGDWTASYLPMTRKELECDLFVANKVKENSGVDTTPTKAQVDAARNEMALPRTVMWNDIETFVKSVFVKAGQDEIEAWCKQNQKTHSHVFKALTGFVDNLAQLDCDDKDREDIIRRVMYDERWDKAKCAGERAFLDKVDWSYKQMPGLNQVSSYRQTFSYIKSNNFGTVKKALLAKLGLRVNKRKSGLALEVRSGKLAMAQSE